MVIRKQFQKNGMLTVEIGLSRITILENKVSKDNYYKQIVQKFEKQIGT